MLVMTQGAAPPGIAEGAVIQQVVFSCVGGLGCGECGLCLSGSQAGRGPGDR